MNLNENFPVSPAKIAELKSRIVRLGVDLPQVTEQFVRGSGACGQKINKTSSCVMLNYAPLNLTVKCQESRQRSLNRFLALRELVDRIEMQVSPGTSRRLAEIERIRKQKSRRRRKFFNKPENE